MSLPKSFLTRPLAHRGLHDLADGVPENGMEAMRRAVAGGFGMELDLQVSADGVAMAFHDATLDRMTCHTGLVRERRAAELARVALNGSGAGVPTLADVLAMVDGRAPVLIEMKDQSGKLEGTDGALEAATMAALAGYHGPVAVMSFNPDQVAEFARIAPEVPRGLVTSGFPREDWANTPEPRCTRLRDIPDFDRVGAGFISHDRTDLGSARVAELRAAGVPVLTWTIRSAEAEALARQVAHNITFEQYLPQVAP